ncbi:hypothetical protein C4K04_4684 [Pseudomonas chlororaphis]|uniref:Uncharacterized protein n=1 Tax=Pseudomonas chlororaphis TaxID=587753 RepID=A0A3G7TVI7_9PSED|nr:neuraminidase-like domain-containing protein [Pseudomonas chlororaphis]AZE50339.1 hypothetical protein C4K04_4684 [Pseudomonas chlororaphis]
MPTEGWTEGLMQYLEESRDAHCSAYLAWCIPDEEIDGVPLSDIIKTQDDLYSYLLLDTRISAIVDTTWVAETMTSLQQFINQSLSADNNEVDEAINSTLVEQSRSGGFLYDWTDYNQSYDTWSGKERLQYYPSTYIYPTPRSNQTVLFTAMDQTISQGDLNFENVERAVTQYINDFIPVSTLTTVSGYQTGDNSTKSSQGKVYFIGQTQDQPYRYYLRRCDLAIRNSEAEPMPTAGSWSEWIAISAPIESPINNSVASFFYGERLYICWLSKETDGSTMSEGQTEATYTNWLSIYYRDSGGQWSSFRKLPLPSNIQNPTNIAAASNAQKPLSSLLKQRMPPMVNGLNLPMSTIILGRL